MGFSTKEVPPIGADAAVAVGDVRNSDKLLMLGATIGRMGGNLLTFVILARYLGPASFGVIATAITYTSFAALVADFGFAVSALRRAGAVPERAGTFVSEALLAKALLTVAITVVGATVLWLMVPTDHRAVFALTHVGAVAFSFAEMMLVVPRAIRRYDVEARVVAISSTAMLILVGSLVALTRDVTTAAAAFAGGRVLYLLLVYGALRRWLPPWRDVVRGWGAMVRTLRSSASYAADSILTTFSGQADILLFAAVLSAHDIGVYQAGARLVQAIMPFAVVMASVYLPPLAAAMARQDGSAFRRNASRLNLEFAGLALTCLLGFTLLGPFVTKLLYGVAYQSLVPLWNGFALYAALRLLAAGFGIQLAARGQIAIRILGQLTSIAVLAISATLALDRLGLPATSWMLAASSLPLALLFGGAVWRSDPRDRTALLALAAIILLAVLLIGWEFIG